MTTEAGDRDMHASGRSASHLTATCTAKPQKATTLAAAATVATSRPRRSAWTLAHGGGTHPEDPGRRPAAPTP